MLKVTLIFEELGEGSDDECPVLINEKALQESIEVWYLYLLFWYYVLGV